MDKFIDIMIDCTKHGRKIKKGDYLEEGKYAVIDQGQKQCVGYSNEEEGLFHDVPAIIFGDHTRVIKYIDEPFFLGADGVKVLRSKDNNVDYRYLYYALRNVKIENTGYNRHFKWLKESRIRYPKLNKQQEIATVLGKVERIIELKERELKELDVLIKSRFVEMFGFIDETEFDVYELKEITEFITDGTHQTPTYTDDKVNGFKFLSSKDVTSGKINWSKIKYIPSDLHEKLYKKVSPQRNDILLAKNGTTGVAALVDNDEIFDIYVSLAILRFKEGNNPYYLLNAINSVDTKRQFNSSLKGVGVPNLHLGEIRKTRIVLPPIEMQNQYADFVKQVDKLKVEVRKSLSETQLLFDSLMQEYFE
jgi:type I restriction enzyme S subunit